MPGYDCGLLHLVCLCSSICSREIAVVHRFLHFIYGNLTYVFVLILKKKKKRSFWRSLNIELVAPDRSEGRNVTRRDLSFCSQIKGTNICRHCLPFIFFLMRWCHSRHTSPRVGSKWIQEKRRGVELRGVCSNHKPIWSFYVWTK